MNKAKLRKSMVKLSQDSAEVSRYLSFLPLVSLTKGQLKVHTDGLDVIEEQSAGRTYLLALYSRTPSTINAIYRNNNLLQEEHSQSGVWITNYPRYDSNSHRQFLFLHVVARAPEDAALLHAFCSVIASAVLLDLNDLTNFDFLAGINARVIFNESEKDKTNNANERRKQLANIVFLQKSKSKQSAADLRRGNKELEQVCVQKGVPGEFRDLHKEVNLLRLSNDTYEGDNGTYLNKLEEELRDVATRSAKNEDLRNGPILRQYVELVGQALGNSGFVDITATTAGIRISEGYHAYLKATESYHAGLKRELRDEGVPNIKEILLAAREDAVEEYRQLSNDAVYLLRFEEHISDTEKRLTEENNKALDLRSLAYLREASESLLARSNFLKAEQIQTEIDGIVQGYKAQAFGDNKYEILTNYIHILHTAITKNPQQTETIALKKQLQTTRRQRDDLSKDLQALRKQNSSKCCEIM